MCVNSPLEMTFMLAELRPPGSLIPPLVSMCEKMCLKCGIRAGIYGLRLCYGVTIRVSYAVACVFCHYVVVQSSVTAVECSYTKLRHNSMSCYSVTPS